MKEGEFNLDKPLIASGFVGPLIFFMTMYFLFPLFYPGFNPSNQTISELGEIGSPVKMPANVFGFSLFGIFITLFAFGVFKSSETRIIGKISSLFLLLTGILMYLVGIFHSGSNFSTMASLHNIVANYQFPIFAIGLVLLAIDFLSNKKLRWLTPVIIFLGIIALALAYVFFFTHDLENRGIWQRTAIGLPYSIMIVISMTLYKGTNYRNYYMQKSNFI